MPDRICAGIFFIFTTAGEFNIWDALGTYPDLSNSHESSKYNRGRVVLTLYLFNKESGVVDMETTTVCI